ncbi:hypothetical protein HWD94_03855 [Pseudarthrobacter equi]|uniref:hypothetical protein n=1 Tax=Pseudarthrobacter equi TaxID=728066 RepID=UPI0021C0F0C5|nr:hypothetical protein [Pseudarthrobacter equi]MCT9624258.1 hypothetical protein [Pseudarthrobacter equi]
MTKTVPRRGQAKKRKTDPGGSPGKPLSEVARQRILDAYVAGVSINGIAATFSHAKSTVRSVLRGSEVQLRDDAAKPKMSREELVQRHKEGWTPRMIADACGAHIATVHKRMADLGLRPEPRIPDLPMTEIMAARNGGQSLNALAEQYGVHRETLARRVAAAGVTPAQPVPVISVLKLADLCRRGMTAPEMSRATGINQKTLRKHLAAAGMRAADKRPGRERKAFVPDELMGPST